MAGQLAGVGAIAEGHGVEALAGAAHINAHHSDRGDRPGQACMAKASRSLSRFVRPGAELLSKNRQIGLHDAPNHGEAEAEILVNDAVAQPSDGCPVDLRLQELLVIRNAPGGFTNDFKVANHGIDSSRICAEHAC